MNKIKYLFFVLIIFLVPNVYAQEFNVSSSEVTCPLTSGTGKYCGAEVYYTGTSAAYSLGTRYDGRLNRIWFNLIAGGYADSEGFEKGHTYTVTMNMATNDWNNKFGSVSVKCDGSSGTELVKGGITYVSYKKIKFTFQAPANDWCQFVYVDIRSSSGNTITQISNWNLSSLTISDSAYDSGGSGGSGGTTDPNQSIIDANNENTTQIIDNQNQNTNDIISSIQETTSQVNETINNVFNEKCNNLFNKNDVEIGGFLTDGSIVSNNTLVYTNEYIEVLPNTSYTFSSSNSVERLVIVEYNSSKTFIQRDLKQNDSTYTIITTANTKYVRLNSVRTAIDNLMFEKGNIRTTYCAFGSNTDQNKIDELNKKLDGLSSVINSEEVPSIDIDIDLASDTPISDLLLMPLNIINKVQTANSGTCTPYVLPFDFFGGNNTLTLPCIDLEDYLGHDVYTVLDTILCFYFAYEIAMLCVSIYNNVTSLNDGFDALYEPKHGAPDGASSYIGRHGGGKR